MSSGLIILVGFVVSTIMALIVLFLSKNAQKKSLIRAEIEGQKAEIIALIEDATEVHPIGTDETNQTSQGRDKQGWPTWEKWLMGLSLLPLIASFVFAGVYNHNLKSGPPAPTNSILVSIAVTPSSSPSLQVGYSQQFTATGTYLNGSTANITANVTWTSADLSIANISSSGLATAVAVGAVNISATMSGITSPAVELRVVVGTPTTPPPTIPNYTLTVQTTGQGSVTPSPQQLAYVSGAVVTLTATPANGWSFSGWSGSPDLTSTTANPTTITMNSNEIVTANFTQQYTLTVQTTGQGGESASPGQATYVSGTVVTLAATPSPGWNFSGWSGTSDLGSTTANPTTITMNGNETVTATFTQIKYALTVQTTGQGSVTASPQESTYASGTVVILSAKAATGWSFGGWSGSNDLASTTANPTTITMNGNETVTCTFTQIIYTLTTSVNPAGEGTVSPTSGNYPSGTSVTLTATAAPGWTFSSWSGSNDITDTTANPTTITMNGNETVTAAFTQITTTSQIINYSMPASYGVGFSVWWTNNLNAGNDIKGTVSLSGSTQLGIDWSSTWTFEIDDPLGNVAFSQSYTFSSGSIKTFDFTTNQTGTWKIKVSDNSNYSRTLQITILPTGWH